MILGDFYIQDISPLEDEQLKMYKNAIAERAKIRVTGKAIEDTESGYRAERTYNTLDKLAANEGGSSSAFTGAGIGLGAGLGLGNKFMDMTNKNMNTTNPEKKSIKKTPAERIIELNELLQNNLISQEEFDSKKKKIID